MTPACVTHAVRITGVALAILGISVLTACGTQNDPPSTTSGECAHYDSTFAAVQERIFEGRGCTADACHGSAAEGGLDLRRGAAYRNLQEVPSSNSSLRRIEPGVPNKSYLYLKLQASTKPGSSEINGSPMPFGQPPLTENELEAVRVWIAAGAPESGSVGDPRYERGSSDYVSRLLDACLPPSEQVAIAPLEAPDPALGIQFEMPPFELASGTEWEGCFASYYDFSAIVPERFQTPDRSEFYVNGTHIRQDPMSHHLVIMHSGLGADMLDHPEFGIWSCRGGARVGETCDPRQLDFCGEGGHCATEPTKSSACIGFGPPGATVNPANFGLGTALQAQVIVNPVTGIYRKIPLKGIVYWNSHAFNLTKTAASVHARLNVLYTDDVRFEEVHLSVSGNSASGVPPFTKRDVCATYTAPQGSKLIRLSSHTHRHGEYFWATDPGGNQIYESFFYSDPVYVVLDPPLVFDSPDQAARTLTYCATFNNGVDENGLPDLDLVTRRSRTPEYARGPCNPVACVSGKIKAACSGMDDNASCDSTPGAGDGACDACPILAGETTEHEMFFLLPDLVMPAGN